MPSEIPDPWRGFLRSIDRALSQPVEVHCLGGFVLAVLWRLPRPTGDVDFIEVEPASAGTELLRVAGEGSEIARIHGLHFHCVTVAECPAGYSSRLLDLPTRSLKRLRLRALEIHDLVLAKLGRNSARDRADVEFLVRKGLIDRQVLADRFEAELRPYVLNEERSAGALRLWLDTLFGANR
jgi:hypothetical protein